MSDTIVSIETQTQTITTNLGDTIAVRDEFVNIVTVGAVINTSGGGFVPYTGAIADVILGAFDLQAQEITIGNGAAGHDPLLTFDGEVLNTTITHEEYVNAISLNTNSRLSIKASDDANSLVIGEISTPIDQFLQLFSSTGSSATLGMSADSAFLVIEAQTADSGLGASLVAVTNNATAPLAGTTLSTLYMGGVYDDNFIVDKGIAVLSDGDWDIEPKTTLNFFATGSTSNAIISLRGDDVFEGNVAFNLENDFIWNGVVEAEVLHVDASLDRVNVFNFAHRGGSLGFYGATPVSKSTGWNVTNLTTDRSYNANATTVDELADVLGTLIEQLKTYGLLGA